MGKSKVELLRAQVESEHGLQKHEEDVEEDKDEVGQEDKEESEQGRRGKLEKTARDMGIEDVESKTSDELVDEIVDNLPQSKNKT